MIPARPPASSSAVAGSGTRFPFTTKRAFVKPPSIPRAGAGVEERRRAQERVGDRHRPGSGRADGAAPEGQRVVARRAKHGQRRQHVGARGRRRERGASNGRNRNCAGQERRQRSRRRVRHDGSEVPAGPDRNQVAADHGDLRALRKDEASPKHLGAVDAGSHGLPGGSQRSGLENDRRPSRTSIRSRRSAEPRFVVRRLRRGCGDSPSGGTVGLGRMRDDPVPG